MDDKSFLASLLSKTTNLVLPFEKIDNIWCVLEDGLFLKCTPDTPNAIKAVFSLPDAYQIARSEEKCFLTMSEIGSGGKDILTGAMIYNDDISNSYGDWWGFRMGEGPYPDDRSMTSKYLKTITFNRVEYPFTKIVSDELGILIHIQPRYEKLTIPDANLLLFKDRALVFQPFTYPKWEWSIVFLNKLYFFDVKFIERLDCIFKSSEEYDKFTRKNSNVVRIGIIVSAIDKWELRYYNERNEVTKITKVTGEINLNKEFSFFGETRKLSDNTIFFPSTKRTKTK